METSQPSRKFDSSTVRTTLIALSIVLSAMVLAHAFRHFVNVRYQHRAVQVTGSSIRRITSDRAIWRGTMTARSVELRDAYRALAEATSKVNAFLVAQGSPDSERIVGAVDTQEVVTTFYERDPHGQVLSQSSRVTGYQLQQTVTVVSNDLPRVQRIAQRVTELLEQGVSVTSEPIEFLYSALGDLKVELISAATSDARRRAGQVAEQSGAALGVLESATVGIVQVNAANATQTSWEGMNDRTSLEKDAMVTVNVTFALR